MFNDYKALLNKIETAVVPMGFSQSRNDEYEAVFWNNSGWFISFEGERYVRPAFELTIGKDELRFSVRILMTVFNVTDKPSLTRQLKFLEEKFDDLFISPPPYLAEYQKADQIV